MNLRHLEVIYSVMKAGSVTSAARMLGMSQPACSMMLKHAESHFGIRLFERVGGRMQPTPDAQALMPHAEAIFDQVSAFNRIAKDLKGGRLGRLTIGSSPGLLGAIIPPAADSFSKKYPMEGFTLLAISRAQVIERVKSGELDIGIVFDPVDSSGIKMTHLSSTEIACVVPVDHPLAERKTIGVADLVGLPVISYGRETMLGGLIAAQFVEATGIEPSIACEVNSATTACILSGRMGYVALIEPLIMSSGIFPGLVVKPFRPLIEHKIQMIEQLNQPRSHLAELFAAHLKTQVPRMRQLYESDE
jgi:DNA-binding transcriptional LysR family regulator